jgi:hypothetical protein
MVFENCEKKWDAVMVLTCRSTFMIKCDNTFISDRPVSLRI